VSILLETVAERYGLGGIDDQGSVEGGYLSRNQIVGHGEDRYFLKQYRFRDEARIRAARIRAARIRAIHGAKFFFAQGDIPIILPLADVEGETFFSCQGHSYALFPFVAGRSFVRGRLPAAALRAMAETLARMHRLGHQARLPGVKTRSLGWGRKQIATFIAEVEVLQSIIAAKPIKDDFDELAAEVLQLRLTLAQQDAAESDPLLLDADHLIHGDFHEANLFFDDAGRVKAVFDLEKVCLWPRVLEVIRAVDFTCFSDGSQSGRAFGEENFAAALTFLNAYHQCYPLDRAELVNGYKNYFSKRVYGLWVETEHYLEHNDRVDGFLSGDRYFLQYFSTNFTSFIARIVTGIF